MKADMSALKEQMASMMGAMLSMKQLIEKNATTAAAVSSAAEADPTLLATAHHPPPNIVGRGRDTLGHDGSPHLGYNRAAYPMDCRLTTHHPSCKTMRAILLLPSLKESLLNSPTRSTKTLKTMLEGMSSSIPRPRHGTPTPTRHPDPRHLPKRCSLAFQKPTGSYICELLVRSYIFRFCYEKHHI